LNAAPSSAFAESEGAIISLTFQRFASSKFSAPSP